MGHKPAELRSTLLGAVSPGQRCFSQKRRGHSTLQNQIWSRSAEVLSNVSGSDPFRHSIPTVKSPSVFGMACTFAGARSERRPRRTMRTCTSTRTGNHLVSHASSVTGGVRKSNRGRPSMRKHRQGSVLLAREAQFTFTRLFRPARFPCPVCPLERCRVWGRRLTGLRGPGLEPGCRGKFA